MSAMHMNQNNFMSEVIRSEKPVLLDFYATWCGPCRMVGPILDEIAMERPDIKVCKVNIDQEPELAEAYGVMSIPTLMVLRDGQVVTKSTGARPKKQILAMLES